MSRALVLAELRRLALLLDAVRDAGISSDARHALDRAALDVGDAIRAEERLAAFVAKVASSGGIVPPTPPGMEN